MMTSFYFDRFCYSVMYIVGRLLKTVYVCEVIFIHDLHDIFFFNKTFQVTIY